MAINEYLHIDEHTYTQRINYKLHSINVDFSCFPDNLVTPAFFTYPFSHSGVYKVYINDKHINTYNHTGLFGELALLYNMPRYVRLSYLIDSFSQIFRAVWATITMC